MQKVRDLSRRAVDSATRADEKEIAAQWLMAQAIREVETGNRAQAGPIALRALAVSPGRYLKVGVAFALARSGDTARAKAMLDQMEKDEPNNTILKVYWFPVVEAAIDLQKGAPEEAIRALEPALPYELGGGGTGAIYPAYVRGQAYLAEKNGPAAVAEFQKMQAHPALVGNSLTGALARLQLGRAYALSGDTAKAKAAYQDFLNLWKDADPDLPIYKEAKAEAAKLE